MKKNLLLISLSISLSFGFMSCGGSENIPTEPEKPQLATTTRRQRFTKRFSGG